MWPSSRLWGWGCRSSRRYLSSRDQSLRTDRCWDWWFRAVPWLDTAMIAMLLLVLAGRRWSRRFWKGEQARNVCRLNDDGCWWMSTVRELCRRWEQHWLGLLNEHHGDGDVEEWEWKRETAMWVRVRVCRLEERQDIIPWESLRRFICLASFIVVYLFLVAPFSRPPISVRHSSTAFSIVFFSCSSQTGIWNPPAVFWCI